MQDNMRTVVSEEAYELSYTVALFVRIELSYWREAVFGACLFFFEYSFAELVDPRLEKHQSFSSCWLVFSFL